MRAMDDAFQRAKTAGHSAKEWGQTSGGTSWPGEGSSGENFVRGKTEKRRVWCGRVSVASEARKACALGTNWPSGASGPAGGITDSHAQHTPPDAETVSRRWPE